MVKMNFNLKTYINKLKGKCFGLGFTMRVSETARDTTAIVFNGSVDKIILLNLEADIYGGIPTVRAYLVNPPRYRWANAEGFTLDQMIELKKERVFIEIDPTKTANYLL